MQRCLASKCWRRGNCWRSIFRPEFNLATSQFLSRTQEPLMTACEASTEPTILKVGELLAILRQLVPGNASLASTSLSSEPPSTSASRDLPLATPFSPTCQPKMRIPAGWFPLQGLQRCQLTLSVSLSVTTHPLAIARNVACLFLYLHHRGVRGEAEI